MPRLDQDILATPIDAYRALATYVTRRQEKVCENSVYILAAAQEILPVIARSDVSPPVDHVSIAQYADEQRMYGKAVYYLHTKVAKGDITKTAALILAGRHGLKHSEMVKLVRSAKKGRSVNGDVHRWLSALGHYIKPEFLGAWGVLAVSPARPVFLGVRPRKRKDKAPR